MLFVILIIPGVRHVCERYRYNVCFNSCLLIYREMVVRNDRFIADNLIALTLVLQP